MSALFRLRTLLLALVALFAFARPAAAVDYTDIWWNPNESGWGVNLVQSNNFIFATFFVYGTNQQPTWVTAQLTLGNNNVWSGPVYFTTGSFYGGPWDPGQSSATEVGVATFVPSDAVNGTLNYNVGGISVAKVITRQTLKLIPAGGKYAGAFTSVYSGCANPANNGPLTFWANLTVNQTPSTMELRFQGYSLDDFSPFNFTMSGNSIQQGQLYQIPGATYLSGSNTLSAQVSEVKVTSQGIEGRWLANLNPVFTGCIENGYFSFLFVEP